MGGTAIEFAFSAGRALVESGANVVKVLAARQFKWRVHRISYNRTLGYSQARKLDQGRCRPPTHFADLFGGDQSGADASSDTCDAAGTPGMKNGEK